MSFDKRKWCKNPHTGEDCPDRLVGCHVTCEGYEFRCQERKRINEARRANSFAPTAQREKASLRFLKKQKKAKIYKR